MVATAACSVSGRPETPCETRKTVTLGRAGDCNQFRRFDIPRHTTRTERSYGLGSWLFVSASSSRGNWLWSRDFAVTRRSDTTPLPVSLCIPLRSSVLMLRRGNKLRNARGHRIFYLALLCNRFFFFFRFLTGLGFCVRASGKLISTS